MHKIRLTDQDGTPMHLTPRAIQAEGTSLFVYDGPACTIRAMDMPGYDYAIVEYTVLPAVDTTVDVESDAPVLLFFIFLEGSLHGYETDAMPVEIMMRLHWNMVFLDSLKKRLVFRKGARYRALVIHFELPFLMQWAGTHRLLDHFFRRSHAGRPAILYRGEHPPASVKMLAAIARITNQESIYPSHVFREVRVLEVLYNAIEPLFRVPPVRNRELTAADVGKIRQAHAYIVDHLDEPVTLQSLAQTLGLNVRKLKQGFRYVYGVTFYALLTAERMEKAGLLLEREMTIREICRHIGYKSASHFTEAYRKYFGYAPERKRL